MAAKTSPVLVSELAKTLGHHPAHTLRDLKKRGFDLLYIRLPSGQKARAVTRADADRYLTIRCNETQGIFI